MKVIFDIIHASKAKFSIRGTRGELNRGGRNYRNLEDEIDSEFQKAMLREDPKTTNKLRRKNKLVLEFLDDHWTHAMAEIKTMIHNEQKASGELTTPVSS